MFLQTYMFYTHGVSYVYGVPSKRKTQGKTQKIKANNGLNYTLNIYKYFQTNCSNCCIC